jgi:hypothetical protein
VDEAIRSAERIELEAIEDFCAAPEPSVRKRLGISCERIGGALIALLPSVPDPTFNRVIGAGVHSPVRPEHLDRLLGHFAQASVERYFFHVCPSADPPELPSWLAERGLRPCPRAWAKFRWSGGGLPTPLPGMRVEAIGAEHATSFAQIVLTAFGMPAPLEPLLAALPGRERWRTYLCFDGKVPFAAGALFVNDAVGWLGFGATLPSHRGRGGQSAILAQRVRDALALGCRMVVTETGEEATGQPQHSFHNIVRAGFRPYYSRENFAPASG